MATPTLDEIEAQIRTLCGEAPTHDGYVRGDVEAACNIALALVAHVRALAENSATALDRDGFMAERITALEAKVAALEAPAPFMPVHDPDGEIGMAFNSIAARLNRQQPAVEVEYQKAVLELCGRARVLAQKVAALGNDVARMREDMHHRKDVEEIRMEHDVRDLRAENAELKRRGEAIQEQMAEGRVVNTRLMEERDRLRAENAELRKRVEAGTWPAPQPIETAPLGDILAGPAPNGFAWAPERPLAGCSLESWRAQLREAERRWWLPMPPPGGGK